MLTFPIRGVLCHFSYEFWKFLPVSCNARGFEEANVALGLFMMSLGRVSQRNGKDARQGERGFETYTHSGMLG